MKDQAENLRLKLQQANNSAKVIAVISGKGGVGKSNFSLNFSLSLASENKRVLLFDMDIGMGNIDILLGANTNHTIIDIFNNELSIHDIINKESANFSYISGGTAFSNLFTLSEDKFEYLLNQLQLIIQDYDYILFDMGAGISEENLNILMAVDDIFVITTPEPTAMMDAYAVMKHICLKRFQAEFLVVINRINSEKEGKVTYQRLYNTMSQFLKKEIKYLGMIQEDKNISKAVSAQTPLIKYNSNSKASIAIEKITNQYMNSAKVNHAQQSSTFISKLKKFFLER